MLSQEDTQLWPQIAAYRGGVSPLFIPVLPQESCGLLRVRESIICLNFKSCVWQSLLLCVQGRRQGGCGEMVVPVVKGHCMLPLYRSESEEQIITMII